MIEGKAVQIKMPALMILDVKKLAEKNQRTFAGECRIALAKHIDEMSQKEPFSIGDDTI
jgi:predicted DNA-binding protein